MLKLRDFFHYPHIEALLAPLLSPAPGLMLVAGLEARWLPPQDAHLGFLPSGRGALFNVLVDEILEARPEGRAILVTTDRKTLRVPRHANRRATFSLVEPPFSYAERIHQAMGQRPDLLVIDQLTAETIPAAFQAAQEGLAVLSQLDTIFNGRAILRCLEESGAPLESLAVLRWVIGVQRLPKLCPQCKQPILASQAQRAALLRLELTEPPPWILEQYEIARQPSTTFYQASGCAACKGSGRLGDIAIADIYLFGRQQNETESLDHSLLPARASIMHLALQGLLSLEDYLNYEQDRLHRTFNLLTRRERDWLQAHQQLQGKLTELQSAQRVMEQRTKALVSLQEIGRTLVSSLDLEDLASQVCRHACELCAADRAVLYIRRGEQAEILAANGCAGDLLHGQVPFSALPTARPTAEPLPYNHPPPGVPESTENARPIRSGLYVPLVAQHEQVGLMIVQSTHKTHFAPGEVALLQTFAIQAALALQRAELVSELRTRLEQLEAAQVELAKKERLERELELARQVQQSVLPLAFPEAPGYQFAAFNQPARQVGGDFYDVIRLDEDRFGIVIADVSDKGMPAALYTALTRSLLLAEARREASPRNVLASVNQLLLELGKANMFVTIFYGIIACSQRRLVFTRAGHDRPVLLRNGNTQELRGEGMALGLFDQEQLNLSEETIELAPGDRLVLYTDGLVDIQTPKGQPLERSQLIDLFRGSAQRDAGSFCQEILAWLSAYQGAAEQYDDMTMLVLAVE